MVEHDFYFTVGDEEFMVLRDVVFVAVGEGVFGMEVSGRVMLIHLFDLVFIHFDHGIVFSLVRIANDIMSLLEEIGRA